MSAIMQNAATTPVGKHGAIRRPVQGEPGEANWSNLPTPVTSEPQSPQNLSPQNSPSAPEKSNSSSSTDTLVFTDAASPFSSPTLSSVSDELKERKRTSERVSDGEWSFFKHGLDITRPLGASDSEDDIDSDKTTAETA